MSGGGKGGGGGEATVGYRYLMGVQLAVCHGPVDKVGRIIIGEREAWVGSVGGNATISINKPDLFGGDNREGGVVGDVDVLMGASDQARNGYLSTYQGATCSAYRGLLSLVFKSFMWSSGNPYFKAPWVEVTRILSGWNSGAAWNAADAVINTVDMNPAHIIYQCLTDPAWGMGYNTSDIGDASFTAAATTLKNEGFGLSLPWDEQSSIEDFIKLILNHVNGALGLNMATGKFELKLIRDDYDFGTLTELNESNVIEVKSFQRAAFGDAINEVVVTYVDRDGNTKPVAVQNLASIAAQGGVISTTKPYPGIRDANLAAKVALRDLSTLASPLAQATVVCNRVLWDKEIGDVVKLAWPSLGVEGVAFRIVHIDKGTLTDAKITVQLVEDVFGLPTANYTVAPPSQWADNVLPPVAAEAGIAVEAPYWEVVKNITLANRAQLEAGYGFGMFLAARGAVRGSFGYVLSASADNVTYETVGGGNFIPTGVLAGSITPTQTSISISGGYDLDAVVLSSDGGYAYIGDECVSVISCDASSGAVVIGRGILDTVPAAHSVGARVFFKSVLAAYDKTERTSGETVYYKPRPTSGLGTLDIDDATADVLVLNNRATRPYPPGNFKIDGVYFPATIPGPNVTATWSHRDRAAQTVDFADHTVGNIGPEVGTTYRMRVYSGVTLLRTYEIDGAATSWSYPTDDDIADGRPTSLRLVLSSVRDGLESLYPQDHSFSRIVATGGTYVEGPPAAPVLSAASAPFKIFLSWVFGDGRTNVESTEIRESRTALFADSTVLQYVLYPTTEYDHELTEVGANRWYWARTLDTTGQLSAWSSMAYARAGFQAGVPSVATLPVVPDEGVDVVRLSTDGKLYIWTGAAWITGVAADDIIGEITGVNIAAGTIAATHIAAEAITTGKLAADAVTTDKIAANAITTAELSASAVTADKIAADAVTANKIAADAVTANKIAANAVTAAKINAGAVTAGKIAANTITAAGGEIADLAVTTLKIGNNAVTIPASGSGTASASVTVDYGSISQTVCVMASANGYVDATSFSNYLYASLYMDGGLVQQLTIMRGDFTTGYVYGSGSFNFTFAAVTGTHTFTVQLSSNAGYGGVACGIVALGVKK